MLKDNTYNKNNNAKRQSTNLAGTIMISSIVASLEIIPG
jgi:hypothetical protein